jgi:hypothetical protein
LPETEFFYDQWLARPAALACPICMSWLLPLDIED